MGKDRIYIFCSGGLVNNVTGRDGLELEEYAIIDFDEIRDGNSQCPVCYTDIDEDAWAADKCPTCGLRLKSPTQEDALKCAIAWEDAQDAARDQAAETITSGPTSDPYEGRGNRIVK